MGAFLLSSLRWPCAKRPRSCHASVRWAPCAHAVRTFPKPAAARHRPDGIHRTKTPHDSRAPREAGERQLTATGARVSTYRVGAACPPYASVSAKISPRQCARHLPTPVKPRPQTVVIPSFVRMCEFSPPCGVAIWRALENGRAGSHPQCMKRLCQVLQKRLATTDIVLEGKSRDYNLIQYTPSYD